MLKLIVVTTLVPIIVAAVMPGGFSDADVNSQEIKEMASRALMQLNRQGDGRYYNTLVKVVSAQQQVVAGINYRLKLLLGETNCAKSQVSINEVNADSCPESDESKRKLVTAEVWVKSWENFEQITFPEDENENDSSSSTSKGN